MSKHRSSLALEEIKDQDLETKLELYIPGRHLSRSSVAAERQPLVVKVSGSITVSF